MLEDLTGKKITTEDKLAILWKLVKLQRQDKLGKDQTNVNTEQVTDVFVNSDEDIISKTETSEKQSTKTQKPKYMRLEHFTER